MYKLYIISCLFLQVNQELLKSGLAQFVGDDVQSVSSGSSAGSRKGKARPRPSKKAVDVVSSDTRLPSIELPIETFEDLNVVYTKSPQMFMCQLTKYSNDLSKLTEKLNEDYKSSSASDLALMQPKLSQICCALFEDGDWYRTKVLQLEEHRIKGYFVDYGDSKWLSLADTKKLKTAYSKLAAQAVPCSLANIKPASGITKWSADAVAAFEELVVDKNLIGKALNKNADGVYTLNLIDVSDREEMDVDIGDSLVQRGHALREGTAAAPSQQFTEMKMNVGQQEMVVIPWVHNPGAFWCQLESSAAKLDELGCKLNEHYEGLRLSDAVLKSPQPGLPCVAMFVEDGNWYRAVVVAMAGTEAKVRFVDYGNTMKTSVTRLKMLKDEFAELPAQVIRCGLAGAQPAGSRWDEKATAKFNELVAGGANCKFNAWENDRYMVELTACTVHGGGSVIEELGKSYLAKVPGNAVAAKPNAPVRHQKLEAPQQLSMAEYPLRELFCSVQHSVFVSEMQSPSKFYLQLASLEEELITFASQVNDEYVVLSPGDRQMKNVVPGAPCCAPFSEDGSWYRGKVTKVDGSQVTVVFVDYGNADVVSANSLKTISETLLKVAPFAIECSLAGVKEPATGWTSQDANRLTELTGDVEVQAVFQTSGQSASVQLQAGDQDVNSIFSKIALPTTNKPVTEAAPQQYKLLTIPEGDHIVYVSHIVSPCQLYIQRADQQEDLNALMEELEAAYRDSSSQQGPDAFPTGTPCAAIYSEDNAWYRAIALEPREGGVLVQFIDYGNTEVCCDYSKLRAVEATMYQHPAFAIECSLAGLVSPNQGWSDQDLIALLALTQDKELHAHISGQTTPAQLRLTDGTADIAEQFSCGRHSQAAPNGASGEASPATETATSTVQVSDIVGEWFLHLKTIHFL